jgi:hypothetical protein
LDAVAPAYPSDADLCTVAADGDTTVGVDGDVVVVVDEEVEEVDDDEPPKNVLGGAGGKPASERFFASAAFAVAMARRAYVK